MWKSVFLREKVTCREQVVTAPTLCANGENEAMTKRGAAITLTPKERSCDKRFEPIGQLHELELARVFRAIEWVAHDERAQFGSCTHR